MSSKEKIDPLAVLDILEDELEERQGVNDRRRQSAHAAKLSTGEDRRSGTDRRNEKSA